MKVLLETSMPQKSQQKNNHLGCLLYKIFGTILEMIKGNTSINWPENKKTNDNA